uniref:RNase III domain-containing protein n=1 Tax=Nelumbo nucifera TaxID=4432 RepID=A0A822YJ48_NELNU|nr:TPA_asm: hypothetical protein HUJ06_009846 [Nelumbo nucifera]
MNSRVTMIFIFIVFAFSSCTPPQGGAGNLEDLSRFSNALEALQKQIGYKFKNIEPLRRAVTHPSYSGENYRALAILGMNVIQTSASLRYLQRDIEMSAKELNRRVTDVSEMQSSCAADALRLGLDKVVRVSRKTDSTLPSVLCGAYRAIFGAIALDMGKADAAGSVFWDVHDAGDFHAEEHHVLGDVAL